MLVVCVRCSGEGLSGDLQYSARRFFGQDSVSDDKSLFRKKGRLG